MEGLCGLGGTVGFVSPIPGSSAAPYLPQCVSIDSELLRALFRVLSQAWGILVLFLNLKHGSADLNFGRSWGLETFLPGAS